MSAIPADCSVGPDLLELAVVRFKSVEGLAGPVTMLYQVPSGSKSSGSGIGDGMGLLEGTEVGDDDRSRRSRCNPKDAVSGVDYTVRAAASGGERVHRVANESDVGDAAGEMAGLGIGLAGGEFVGNGRPHPIAVDSRDAAAGPGPGIGPDTRSLLALPDGG